MEDLLDEKDFTQAQNIPTPYRHYGVFMIVALIAMFVVYMAIKLELQPDFFIWLELLSPVVTILVMFFWKRIFVRLTLRQVIFGVFLLIMTYYFITVVVNATFSVGNKFLTTTVYYFFQFILCLIVMTVIKITADRKRKAIFK